MNHEQFREFLSGMPPLPHSVVGAEDFEIDHSKVVQWLMDHPGVKRWLFERAKGTGCIVYDKSTGLWSGKFCDAEFDEQVGRKPIDRAIFLEAIEKHAHDKEHAVSIAALSRIIANYGTPVSSETTRAILNGLAKTKKINADYLVRPYLFWALTPPAQTSADNTALSWDQ